MPRPWRGEAVLFVCYDFDFCTACLGALLCLKGSFWLNLTPLGTLFGIWTAPGGTFSDLGGSLGDLVAPNGFQNRLFGFWMPFGLHFGRLLGARVGSGRSFGSFLVPFGRSLAVVFGFCV